MAEASGKTNVQKRTFDAKAFQQAKQVEDDTKAEVKEVDLKSIKLTNLPQNLTEDDIRAALKKWGNISRVRIPEDPIRKRKLGFAIVGFDTE